MKTNERDCEFEKAICNSTNLFHFVRLVNYCLCYLQTWVTKTTWIAVYCLESLACSQIGSMWWWGAFCLVFKSQLCHRSYCWPQKKCSIALSKILTSVGYAEDTKQATPPCFIPSRMQWQLWLTSELQISAPAVPQATTNAVLHGFDSICAVFSLWAQFEHLEIAMSTFCPPSPVVCALCHARFLYLLL